MDINQFDYELPESLIAQRPASRRSASRLLEVPRTGEFSDRKFSDIGALLRPGDLLVANNTRVLPARLLGNKPSGGKVEVMLERFVDQKHALVMLGANKPIKPGQVIRIDQYQIRVLERVDGFFLVAFPDDCPGEAIFQQKGQMPLPPYIARHAEDADKERYQTVYASEPGAVAAPTAGLHFDQTLIDELKSSGVGWAEVTLHVGAGTFQPVRVKDLDDHKMHGERIMVTRSLCDRIGEAVDSGGRVIAIGTTVVRALESAAQSGTLKPQNTDTHLFITPGFRFKVVDALVTNFHLPKSTLLVMVCAFAGYQRIMDAYRYAIDRGYRFYSYGDAMFVERDR